jgi:adenylate cyclase
MLITLNNNRKIRFLANGLVILAILVGVYQLSFWADLDNTYNDIWRRHIANLSQPDERILVIEIDDRSLEELETQFGRWPWPRTVYGFLVEGLTEANSQAIVFDILFSERDIYQDKSDEHFAESVHAKDNIFFAATYLGSPSPANDISFANLPEKFFQTTGSDLEPIPRGNFVLPWILHASDWNIGLINYLADSDGTARRYAVVTAVDGWKMHSLPSRVVEYATSSEDNLSATVGNAARIYQHQTPDTINLKFPSRANSFKSISYADAKYLLENQQQLELFKNKIIIVGATATGLHDLRPTPIDQLYPATYIIATAIDNLLNDDYLMLVERDFGVTILIILIILLGMVMYFFQNYRTQVMMSFTLLVVTAMGLGLLSLQLSKADMLFPSASIFVMMTSCIVLAIFYRGFKEYIQRRHALQTFSRFMDPQVVRQLIDDVDWQNKLAHKSSEVSVLFSDIRGFTSLSEKRSAEQIMQILNDYFDLQVETIFANKGTLDKFIGDAVMAFWGAPVEDKEHARRAVDTALTMVDNLMQFRETLPVELQDFDIGIGIHSGPAVVGMLGSAKRFDYTAIGDTVNLASRVEGVTKGLARVLISEQTKALCEAHFNFEFKGEFSVKGRERPVNLYEPSRLDQTD